MARQTLLPGFGVVDEDGERQTLLPGFGVVHEDQAAAGAAGLARLTTGGLIAGGKLVDGKLVAT